MDEYHMGEQIGEGSFGKVYKGRRRYTSQVRPALQGCIRQRSAGRLAAE
jgi:serine/threonine protein kinase